MTNPIDPKKYDGTTIKINSRSPTKYKPVQLCDDSVYEDARHYYTAQEIADRFQVTVKTLMALHGDAFDAGKREAYNKPRMALNKIIDDFMEQDPVTGNYLHFANKDVPVERLQKALEFQARKYEGYGREAPADAIAKPSVSDVKFDPLEGEEAA